MAGVGRKGKPVAVGKVAAKRAKTVNQKPLIQGITKGDIRRMARKGGVKRIAFEVYDYSRDSILGFLKHLVKDAVTYTMHGSRKTITAMDVVMAMKRNGKSLYGYV